MAQTSKAKQLIGFGNGEYWYRYLEDLAADLAGIALTFAWVPGIVQPATTAGKVKTTAACQYCIAGTGYQKAATDNLFDLTAITTGAAGYAKVLLQLDTSGNATVKKGAEAASLAAAAFPAPDAGKCPVGWVQLSPSYAGGALAQSQLFDGTPYQPLTLQ
jgi:hypothetical protein